MNTLATRAHAEAARDAAGGAPRRPRRVLLGPSLGLLALAVALPELAAWWGLSAGWAVAALPLALLAGLLARLRRP